MSPDFRPDWAPLFLLEVDFLAKLVKSLLALFMPEVMCAVQGSSSVLEMYWAHLPTVGSSMHLVSLNISCQDSSIPSCAVVVLISKCVGPKPRYAVSFVTQPVGICTCR